jgi:hypothetical protein
MRSGVSIVEINAIVFHDLIGEGTMDHLHLGSVEPKPQVLGWLPVTLISLPVPWFIGGPFGRFPPF